MSHLPPNLTAIHGFYTVRQILDFPKNDLKIGQLVSVTGLIKDFQSPISTKGLNWKCTLEIIDLSVQSSCDGLILAIFWPESSMTMKPMVSDAVIISKAKIQVRDGLTSLISNMATTLYILPKKDIPSKPSDAHKTLELWMSYSQVHNSSSISKALTPNIDAIKYAISIYLKKPVINALQLSQEHVSKSRQVKNMKNKFSLMKDIEPNCFYNIIGDVRKIYYSSDFRATIYVSDYTENSRLLNYESAESFLEPYGQDGDNFCYTKMNKGKNSFPGPYGKLVVQIGLSDNDVEYIKSEVKFEDWLLIENIRMKLDHNDLLEGYVHSENGKIHVRKLSGQTLSKDIISRKNEAVQRKLSWWKAFLRSSAEIDKSKIINDSPNKRGLENDNETSLVQITRSKQRRTKVRAEAEKKYGRCIAEPTAQLQLNQNIQSEYSDQMVVAFKDILSPEIFSSTRLGKFYAPFTNRRYRAKVRVVDYFPEEIENFAVKIRSNEIQISSKDGYIEPSNSRTGYRWEWRFSFLLEDALVPEILNKDRIWVLVDNRAAQNLLAIEEEATDLRQDPILLSKVKEQLFKLWGDLEERKTMVMQQKVFRKEPLSSVESNQVSSPLTTNIGSQPDPDSGTEMEKEESQQLKKLSSYSDQTKNFANNFMPVDHFNYPNLVISNKAFICCIQQYGIEIPEEDPMKSDAGPGKRWQRHYGLFGTKIL